MQNFQNIDSLVAAGNLDEAVERLTAMLGMVDVADADEIYFRRGKLYWRLGDRAAATSDYSKAVAINPSSPAAKALEQARDVADFFNPDLYNP